MGSRLSCGNLLFFLASAVSGEAQEHIVEGGTAHPDILDLHARVAQSPSRLCQDSYVIRSRCTDLAGFPIHIRVRPAHPAYDSRRRGQLAGATHDDVDAIAADP